jgi:hypothetical protein
LKDKQNEYLKKFGGFSKNIEKEENSLEEILFIVKDKFYKLEEIYNAFGNKEIKSQSDLMRNNIKELIIILIQEKREDFTLNQRDYLNSNISFLL